MTSKEALERIKNHNTYTTNIEFKIIERDLKVLDIIKENFVWLDNGKLYCGRIFDIEIPIDEDIEEQEEMELLREWLENE